MLRCFPSSTGLTFDGDTTNPCWGGDALIRGTVPVHPIGRSVETAANPEVAEAVTVGGMRVLLEACAAHGVKKVCFSDSIGSFGHGSPRDGATARWLVEHPEHDPGSE